MIILGIETSCDETSLCLIKYGRNTIEIQGDETLTQTVHAEYGGVYPNLAKREHAKNLIPLFKRVLSTHTVVHHPGSVPLREYTELKDIFSKEPELYKSFLDYIPTIEKPAIDAIAVTHGPGLEPALWVGVNFARALSLVWNIPLYPINHLEGHIRVALLHQISESQFSITKPAFPAIALIVSGGHTELVLMNDTVNFHVIGATKDDAVGEAYDKVARIIGLRYPGGPKIDKLAEQYRSERLKSPFVFPRPMIASNDLNFSFSGLKTAVLYKAKELKNIDENAKKIIAFEFEQAVIDVLSAKTKKALEIHGAKSLILGGGVVANGAIRHSFLQLGAKMSIQTFIPQLAHSTDNAFMIAVTGGFHVGNKKPSAFFEAEGNLKLE